MDKVMIVVLSSLIRHLLTYFGAEKFVSSTEIEKAAGAILFLVGFGWSVWKGLQGRKGLKGLGGPGGPGAPGGLVRKSLLLLFVPVLGSGCVMQRAVSYNAETKETTRYTGVAWFNNAAVKGLNVGKRTKTTSNLFSLEEGSNEVQTEALKAMAEGLATGAVKGAVPLP